MIKLKINKIIAIFIVLAIIVTVTLMLVPSKVKATSDATKYIFDISEGSIIVNPGVTPNTIQVTYGGSNTTPEFSENQQITFIGTSGNSLTPILNHIEVKAACNIKFNDLSIYSNYISPTLSSSEAMEINLPITVPIGTVNIDVSGTNILRSSGTSNNYRIISLRGNIALQGAGSLDVSADTGSSDMGIVTNNITDNININDCTIIAQNCNLSGILSHSNLTIDSAIIDVSESGTSSGGIYAGNNISISNSKVISQNISPTTIPAIRAVGNIDVNSGTVDLSNISSGLYSDAKITITGGVINTRGASTYGLLGSEIAISGGTIDASNCGSYGIEGYTTTKITGGSINATSYIVPTDGTNSISMNTISNPNVTTASPINTLLLNGVKNTTYGLNDAFTDNTGNAYIWLPGTLTGLQINVPTEPLNVIAIANTSGVILSWSSPFSDSGYSITDYKIIPYNVTTNTTLPSIDTGSASNTYQVTGLKEGDSYSFKVVATNIFNDSIPSAPSNIISIPISVKGVTLDKSTANMMVGGLDLTLKATVLPANAANKAVVWSTSDPSIATVDSNGVVHAVGQGIVVITVTTVDGGYTATCTVTVGSALIPTPKGGVIVGDTNELPKTGEMVMMYMGILLIVLGLGIFITRKKIKNKKR